MKHRVEEHPLSLRPKMAGVVLITDSKVVKPLKPFYYSQNNWPTSPFRRADLHECTLNRKMTGRYKKVNVLNVWNYLCTNSDSSSLFSKMSAVCCCGGCRKQRGHILSRVKPCWQRMLFNGLVHLVSSSINYPRRLCCTRPHSTFNWSMRHG